MDLSITDTMFALIRAAIGSGDKKGVSSHDDNPCHAVLVAWRIQPEEEHPKPKRPEVHQRTQRQRPFAYQRIGSSAGSQVHTMD